MLEGHDFRQPRVTKLLEFRQQPAAEIRLRVCIFRSAGHIRELMGIGAEVVEFLRGPLCKRVVVEPLPRGIVTMTNHPGLGGTGVHIGEGSVGVAFDRKRLCWSGTDGPVGRTERPTVGGKVADVEILGRADGPARIGQIALAGRGDMPLPTRQHMRA
jgi:hypothetical protein